MTGVAPAPTLLSIGAKVPGVPFGFIGARYTVYPAAPVTASHLRMMLVGFCELTRKLPGGCSVSLRGTVCEPVVSANGASDPAAPIWSVAAKNSRPSTPSTVDRAARRQGPTSPAPLRPTK